MQSLWIRHRINVMLPCMEPHLGNTGIQRRLIFPGQGLLTLTFLGQGLLPPPSRARDTSRVKGYLPPTFRVIGYSRSPSGVTNPHLPGSGVTYPHPSTEIAPLYSHLIILWGAVSLSIIFFSDIKTHFGDVRKYSPVVCTSYHMYPWLETKRNNIYRTI